MRLTVLGAAAPFPRPDEPCSGYLVRGGGRCLWVDCGPGTLAELQRHVRLPELDAIWLSHLHADHSGDLSLAYYAYAFSDSSRGARPTVMGPPGWTDRVAGFVRSDVVHDLTATFRAVELTDGHRVDLGSMRLSTRSTNHDMESFGLRVAAEGMSFAYSGDSAPCDALLQLAQGSDLFLCEAGYSVPPQGPPAHCTPEQAAEVAREAGAGTLVLTHLAEGLSHGEALRRAATVFKGEIEMARPGLAIELGNLPEGTLGERGSVIR